MEDREKLIQILSVPIHPRIGADPAEVVADYLMDNGVRPERHAFWELLPVLLRHEKIYQCSECGTTIEVYGCCKPNDSHKYCQHCGALMDEVISNE